MKSFRERFDFDNRKVEAERIISKYPTRIPVIVEKSPACEVHQHLDRSKFLVPGDLKVSEFYMVIRKRMRELPPHEALFFFVGDDNMMAKPSSTMSAIYQEMKSEDGFLYMSFNGESTFG